MTTLNIGLDRARGGQNSLDHTLATLRAVAGWTPRRIAVWRSDTEDTLVAEGGPLNAALAFATAQALDQDAIAVWDGREGDLWGPNAHAWGHFNPDHFIQLDGVRLNGQRVRVA